MLEDVRVKRMKRLLESGNLYEFSHITYGRFVGLVKRIYGLMEAR